jgi:parallel beta-helix repeat protein
LRRLPTILVVLALAASFLAVGAAPALAGHVRCGDTITQDTKLDSDLIDCPAVGLNIGADGITLDLDGHTIDGAVGSSYGVANGGITVFRGHDNVVVKDGTIREFGGPAIVGGDARRNLFEDLALSHDGGGVQCACPGGIVERNSILDSNGVGIEGIQGGVIKQNTLIGTGGIFANSSQRVQRNVISGSFIGINMEDPPSRTQTVEDNTVYGNEIGIHFGDFGGVIVRRNNIFQNTTGIVVGDGHNIEISHNRIASNEGDGVFATDGTSGVVFAYNVASDNGDDGIEVRDPENTIAHNRADNNGDLGIEAVAGVIDGGGNKAFGNGNPLQCLNVECK